MSHPIWKGGISAGLVHIPVSLYAASETSEQIGVRQLHGTDLAPIPYRRVCSAEGAEVPWGEKHPDSRQNKSSAGRVQARAATGRTFGSFLAAAPSRALRDTGRRAVDSQISHAAARRAGVAQARGRLEGFGMGVAVIVRVRGSGSGRC